MFSSQKPLKWWLWEFKICWHPSGTCCADSTNTLVPLHKCVSTLIWSYCQQGGSKSLECPRVSAVIDGRVQLVLPVRTACVTFAHQSSMEICCGLSHSSTWGVQQHCWRAKCYPKVCSLQVGQHFFSGPSLLAWMNSAKKPELLWAQTRFTEIWQTLLWVSCC